MALKAYLKASAMSMAYPLKEKEFPEIVIPGLGIKVWCKEGTLVGCKGEYREFYVSFTDYQLFTGQARKVNDTLLMKELKPVFTELKKEYALDFDELLNILDAVSDKAREFTKAKPKARSLHALSKIKTRFERYYKMENKETKRWRAQKGEIYYLVHHRLGACSNVEGNGTIDSEIDFISGNYFRTLEEAEQVSEEITKTLLRANNELRDFEWALMQLRKGLRVRRLSWGRCYPSHLYIDPVENCVLEVCITHNEFFTSSEVHLFSDDILAADWELYV